MELSSTYESSPNIALVKYWGKYDEKWILPINDNIGLTLNSKDFQTKTSIRFSAQIQKDVLILNGKQHAHSERLNTILSRIRERARHKFSALSEQQWQQHHFHIESKNSFPTASGMASSASGLACLAAALNGLFGNILTEQQLSELARLGSGSASRSIFGGLVKWNGVDRDLVMNMKSNSQKTQLSQSDFEQLSKKCISYTIRSHEKLSFIRIICLLANYSEKQTPSTTGMKRSVETSELIKYRNEIAQKRIDNIEADLASIDQSRQNKDKSAEYTAYSRFAESIIKDSNQFHAICLDTYPPIFYLNEFSQQIIDIVDNNINKDHPLKVGYTFDAGPHAFMFVHEDRIKEIVEYFRDTFNLSDEQLNENAKGICSQKAESEVSNTKPIPKYEKAIVKPYALWTTMVGEGSRPCDL